MAKEGHGLFDHFPTDGVYYAYEVNPGTPPLRAVLKLDTERDSFERNYTDMTRLQRKILRAHLEVIMDKLDDLMGII